MKIYENILAKHEDAGAQLLTTHLHYVAILAQKIASCHGMNEATAVAGAILHDIGKVSPLFQRTLRHGFMRPPGFVFRHEIASLFFISQVDDILKEDIVNMIVAHHKSVRKDVAMLGLLDLAEYDDGFKIHSSDFHEWVPMALDILHEFGFKVHDVSLDEAKANYDFAVEYCRNLKSGCSKWKGLLMTADYMASALPEITNKVVGKLFIKPELSFYNRRNQLYPLSLINASDLRNHTIVTAPTGAGKTDFLMRRCCGRVFYILPYQASINAMYDRFTTDLSNTDAQIYLQHAASNLKLCGKSYEERIMQRHPGASIKVMTPHQIASVVFGVKGYESIVLDLEGCDVILDEIHTYSSAIQAIVLRIVEILTVIGCRVHIGSATMPSVLYDRLLSILGGPEKVYEVRLSDDVLKTFNRHVINKISGFDSAKYIIADGVASGKKILVVCNQVQRAQNVYSDLKRMFPEIRKMLIHSRFRRKDRQKLEKELTSSFNTMDNACIVVSTQVVEVSLDISFDLMITECAPIDAMIQRFGRVNRKRVIEQIGILKPVYVISPDAIENALPYDAEVLSRSFDVLPDGEVLEENEIQQMLDTVYPNAKFMNLDYSGDVAFMGGKWVLKELRHNQRSAMLEAMDINSVSCLLESDEQQYLLNCGEVRTELEIPVSYRFVAYLGLRQCDSGSKPFVLPDSAYDEEFGLNSDQLKKELNKPYDFL